MDNVKRLNMRMAQDLYDFFEDLAKKNVIPTSAAITMALMEFRKQAESLIIAKAHASEALSAKRDPGR